MRLELRSITGLRGVAACAVMVGHFTEESARSGLGGRLLDHTYYAVDLFFVLSGFVLAMVYGRPRASEVQSCKFFQHRIARIYPLYAITTLVSFLLARAGFAIYGNSNSSFLALISNLAMTQSWGWPSDSLNGPGWSISTEWAANLLFPMFASMCLRCSWLISSLFLITAAICWLVSANLAVEQYWGTPIILHLGWLRIPQPLIGCSMEFFAGMFCWRLREDARWSTMLARSEILWLVMIAAVLSYLAEAAQFAFVVSSCLLVIGLSFETATLARLLGSALPHRLGLISYSIYLVHAPTITLAQYLTGVLNRAALPFGHTIAILFVMACALGLADLSYRYVEFPLRNLVRRGFEWQTSLR